jgi:hypothetical protein
VLLLVRVMGERMPVLLVGDDWAEDVRHEVACFE